MEKYNFDIMLKRTVSFVFVLVISFQLMAQITSSEKKSGSNNFAGTWQLGANIGPDLFFGDLSTYNKTPFDNVYLAGSVHFGRQFSNVIGLRLQLLFGGLRGTKHYQSGNENVNQSFSGLTLEFNTNATINFSNFISPYKPSRRFFVYGTIGIGVSNWRTKRVSPAVDGVTPVENPIQWKSAAVLPFGIGAFYKVGNKVNIGLEWTWHMVFSDLMDQTVGGFKYDIYDYLALGVTINLGGHGKKSLKVLDYSSPLAPVPIAYPVQQDTLYPKISRPAEIATGEFIYSVQVCAYGRHQYSTKWVRRHYKIAQPVRMEKDGSMERFLVGNYKDLDYARELCQTLVKQGIHDAFVVAYKNGVRDHSVAP